MLWKIYSNDDEIFYVLTQIHTVWTLFGCKFSSLTRKATCSGFYHLITLSMIAPQFYCSFTSCWPPTR